MGVESVGEASTWGKLDDVKSITLTIAPQTMLAKLNHTDPGGVVLRLIDRVAEQIAQNKGFVLAEKGKEITRMAVSIDQPFVKDANDSLNRIDVCDRLESSLKQAAKSGYVVNVAPAMPAMPAKFVGEFKGLGHDVPERPKQNGEIGISSPSEGLSSIPESPDEGPTFGR